MFQQLLCGLRYPFVRIVPELRIQGQRIREERIGQYSRVVAPCFDGNLRFSGVDLFELECPDEFFPCRNRYSPGFDPGRRKVGVVSERCLSAKMMFWARVKSGSKYVTRFASGVLQRRGQVFQKLALGTIPFDMLFTSDFSCLCSAGGDKIVKSAAHGHGGVAQPFAEPAGRCFDFTWVEHMVKEQRLRRRRQQVYLGGFRRSEILP